MVRRVLLIAYYFPPLGLSGVQRVAKMAKYLPEFGWDVSVLSARPGSYFAYDESLLKELDRPGITIHRTASLDPTRLIPRRHVQMPNASKARWVSLVSQTLFQPDNKIGWYPFAVRRGRQILNDTQHHAVLSSAPPYTAHLIGTALAQRSGLPLIIDYRDDWLQNPRHSYPSAWHRNQAQKMEERVFKAATRTISINSHIRNLLQSRSRSILKADSHEVIPHGFDPEDFIRSQADFTDIPTDRTRERMELLYTGVFYDAQKPDVFLKGLARYLAVSPGNRTHIRATFLGLLSDSSLVLIKELGLSDVVHYGGYLTHSETTRAMQQADVLWMTIGRQSGESGISTGKLYEYFGSRKPVMGLVPEGVASSSLQEYGAGKVVDPDDPDGVSEAIRCYYNQWKNETLPVPDERFVSRFNRRNLASDVASILNNATKSGPE